MAGDAAERPATAGSWTDAAEHPAPGVSGSVGAIRSTGTAVCVRRTRSIRRKWASFMPSGSKIRSRGELVERLAADPLDEPAQDQEPDVGIAEPLARRPDEVELGEPLPGGLGAVLDSRRSDRRG